MRLFLHRSPHADARPDGSPISLIVLHAISLPPGCFALDGPRALFLGRLDCARDPRLAPLRAELEELRVSAHCLIDRAGDIHQFVPLAERAWHAGVSCWRGRERCNDFSIGIELIGDETTPFTEAQYHSAAALCRTIIDRYPTIDEESIVGHRDIAPGRKWDPGAQWNHARFLALLRRAAPLPPELRLQ
ncbi:MAG: 1,6-anhydro-N-acetylmuramyl-L-alanine amidase AmpD [Zetaproteobacteria bacterium]|nr:MAG: 1,6-anhydro-N-acetylmuramyl-L-alanine amidase AmpD [Zetaproteobacteria bacterium]